MKKVGLLAREKLIEEIKKRVENTESLFFITFNKVNAFSLNLVRNNLKKAGATVFVTKNSLVKRAFENLGYKDLHNLLEAETGVVFVYDKDIVKAAKLLVDFSKENETFKLKGGYLGEERLAQEQLVALAKLPSKEILLAMALRGITSPLTSFFNALNQVILKFVWVIDEIKKKKGGNNA